MQQFPVRWKSRPAIAIAALVTLMLFYLVINNNQDYYSNSKTSSATYFQPSHSNEDNVRMEIPMCNCWKWIPKRSEYLDNLSEVDL